MGPAGFAPAPTGLKVPCATLRHGPENKPVAPDGIAPPSSGYQPGALLLSYGKSAKWLPTVVPPHDRTGQSRLCSCYTSGQYLDEMVGHPGNAPGISWSQARRIAFFLVPEKTGGPYGPCSHDLPADNRVLCWTELTNLKTKSWCARRALHPQPAG